jgi:carboxypeptidase C (cathepsin A)
VWTDQFHESQRSPTQDPVVAWHTGGPGGSSLYGQWAETGYFQVSAAGEATNPFAWNRVANTLFLESPAGAFLTPSNLHSGFSYCLKNGVRQSVCRWNDVTQAEAYAKTLDAFFAAFPEHGAADIYLVGESCEQAAPSPNPQCAPRNHQPSLKGRRSPLLWQTRANTSPTLRRTCWMWVVRWARG